MSILPSSLRSGTGRDVLTVSDVGLVGHSDDEILQHALGAGRVVVTHDRDFGALALRAHAPCVGIIFLRPAHIVAAFTLDTLAAIDTLDLDLQAPFLLVADRRGEDVRIRVRSLDPG